MSESFRLADVTKAERLAQADTANEWRDVARQMLAEHLQELRGRFEKNEAIEKLIAARCGMVDTIVQSAWHRCFKDNKDISLLATGGYGRTESRRWAVGIRRRAIGLAVAAEIALRPANSLYGLRYRRYPRGCYE